MLWVHGIQLFFSRLDPYCNVYWYNHGSKTALVCLLKINLQWLSNSFVFCCSICCFLVCLILFFWCYFNQKIPVIKSINAPLKFEGGLKFVNRKTWIWKILLTKKNPLKNVDHFEEWYSICRVACLLSGKNWLQVMNIRWKWNSWKLLV